MTKYEFVIRHSYFVIFFIFFGCAGPQVKRPSTPLFTSVAILPFDSESVDVDAPDIMQQLVYMALKRSAYQVKDITVTNEFLKSKGILDGGQLPVLDPVKIASDLDVDGLVYGHVESFGYVNIGVYASRKVVLEIRLVDGTTGEDVYSKTGKGSKSSFAFKEEDIKKNFKKALADQAVDKLFKSPLEPEAKLATRRALTGLQGFRFKGFGGKGKGRRLGKGISKEIINKQIDKK